MAKASVISRHYKIYVKEKLYRTCKSEQEKNAVVAKLKRDKTLTSKDISIGINITVST